MGTNIVRNGLQHEKQRQKRYYDKHAKELTPLRPGQEVLIKSGKTWEPAVVNSLPTEPRSYNVQTSSGQIYRRNRRHLTPARCPQVAMDDDDWPSSDQGTNENSPQESTSEIRLNSDENPTEQVSSASTGSNLRRNNRSVRKPTRYVETWT